MKQAGDKDGEPEKINREERSPFLPGSDAHARIEPVLDRVGFGALGIFKNFTMPCCCVFESDWVIEAWGERITQRC